MSKTIFCDACNESFGVGEVKVREEKLTGGRVGMYFKCPHCQTKYGFASITEKGKKLRKSLKRKVKLIKETPEGAERDKLVNLHSELLIEYSKEVTGPYLEEEVLKDE